VVELVDRAERGGEDMSEVTATQRPPEPDWLALSAEELVAYRDAENRFRASGAVRPITGDPDPGATIQWQELALPGRELPIRVYRPPPWRDGEDADLPLVLHVHGGGFVGTAVQSDWVNSHLAAHLPAVVVSGGHRLVHPVNAHEPLSRGAALSRCRSLVIRASASASGTPSGW
jgi:acetyl esterase